MLAEPAGVGTFTAADYLPDGPSTASPEEVPVFTTCWSAKGGSGTTVVAATLGLLTPRSLIVDLDGDVAPALGLRFTEPAGALDWLWSEAPPAHLADLIVDVGVDTHVLPQRRGVARSPSADRWNELGSWLREWHERDDRTVVVDAGTEPPPAEFLRHGDRDLLVTRACYLSLTAAQRSGRTPSGIVLVHEPGRSIRRCDVESCIGAPIVATVPYDTAVSRAVDSGLLASRLPRHLHKSIDRIAA